MEISKGKDGVEIQKSGQGSGGYGYFLKQYVQLFQASTRLNVQLFVFLGIDFVV